MNTTIGVDIGGTNIKCGKIQDRNLIDIQSEKTIQSDDEQTVIDQVISQVSKIMNGSVKSIGIGVPSVVDTEKGIVYDTVNIPSWKEVHLKEYLEDKFKIPVFVNNDANCFVLGEKHFGKAAPYENIVGLTLGTGIGAGIIINNKLYNGLNCGAGEFGMIAYKDANYEHYCSSNFFKLNKTTAIETYNLALTNDPKALELFSQFGEHLGKAIQTILYAVSPEMIVLGGSISKAFRFFSGPMFDAMNSFAFPSSVEKIRIEVSELENAGIYGAAMLS